MSAFSILLVEDQLRYRQLYEAAIGEALAARVGFAATGPEAIAALAADPPPDLVILDLEIPGTSGLELLRRIKADPRLRQTPVIILTGHSSLNTQTELLDSGADDFIEKGGPPAVLIARLRAQMRHKLATSRLERLALDRDLFAAGVLADIGQSKWAILAHARAARLAVERDPVGEKAPALVALAQLADQAGKLGTYANDVIQSVRDTQRDPVAAPQELAPLLDWAVDVLQASWHAPEPLLPVMADRSFLRLAILNTVQAAQKRAPAGRSVALTVTQHVHDEPADPHGRRFVTTALADDAAPLPPRELAQLFQPSTSIGMALVAKVLARMGGRAAAAALPEDGGTVVALSLPLAKS